MSAQHTPGPWQSDTQYIHAPSNRFLAVLKDGPEQVANSRLIAAAPELKAALARLCNARIVEVSEEFADARIDARTLLARLNP